jgi:hypothetical protein
MTLCIAWIRQEGEDEELVFATDSTLTGGEKWNHGVKLFELPRRDCLICFAGETYRAYPLILNLISSITHDASLQDPSLDIQEVLYKIADTFTDLVNSIFNVPKGNEDEIGSEAKFLFGGWSWRKNRFRIWRLQYSKDSKSFVYIEQTTVENNLGNIAFLGDPEDSVKNITEIARKNWTDEMVRKSKLAGRIDMEPLSVLVDMCRDSSIYEVDGALQIGKVYRSGSNEFFGIYWPSTKGDPSFLSKNYKNYNKPNVNYYDPDTCLIIDEEIPNCLRNIEDFNGTADFQFLQDCYSQDDNFIKQNLTVGERGRLLSIFRDHSYSEFLKVAVQVPETHQPEQ